MSFWIEEQPEYYLSGTVSVSSGTNMVVSVHYSSPKPHAPDLYAARALSRQDQVRCTEALRHCGVGGG